MTDRLREELEAAVQELKAHMAGWEYAYAHAGGPNGGADHPKHAATRQRTEELRTKVRDLKARLAEHEV